MARSLYFSKFNKQTSGEADFLIQHQQRISLKLLVWTTSLIIFFILPPKLSIAQSIKTDKGQITAQNPFKDYREYYIQALKELNN